MKQLIVLCLLLSTFFSIGQNKPFQILGTIVANDDRSALESATVYLERQKDTFLVAYTISNKKGEFILEERSSDEKLNLFISYVGYKTYAKTVSLTTPKIDLGTINLLIEDNTLDEIIIKSRAPITVKNDTLEFNVSSFETKKDGTVEDLLKELPGVNVSNSGKIIVNGKPVNKIVVNGKSFFGDDPTITIRNLTKDIIEKVQIVDTKTKSQTFSGEQGDIDNKTINLIISEDKNKGVFGRVAVGGGTDERYEYAGLLNVFDKDRRMSLLSGGNNINSPGFSFGEISRIFNGGIAPVSIGSGENTSFTINGRSFGEGQGITTSNNAGINYVDNIGKSFEISTDYFFSNSNSENETVTSRENILPTNSFFTNSTSNSFNRNSNHSLNLELYIKVSPTFIIDVNPSIRYSTNENRFSDSQISDKNEEVILNTPNLSDNASSSNSYVETVNRNFNNTLSLTKKNGTKGAFLKFDLTNEIDNVKVDDFLESQTITRNLNPINILRNQFTNEEHDFNRIASSITYRFPLKSKEVFLDFKYNFRNNKREELKSTFDFNEVTKEFTDFNLDLSTDFEFINRRNTPSVGLSFRKKEWSANFETGYVFRTLKNKDRLRPNLSLKQNFENIRLVSSFRYRFNPRSSINFGYNLRNDPPNVSQLQPFQDVSNPLNTVTGNPELEPVSAHNINLAYNVFDFQKKSTFYAYANASFINNEVVAQTLIDENLISNTTYTNVNGHYRIFGSAAYEKTITIDTLQTFKYDVNVFANNTRNINFNNGIQYASINNSIISGLRLTYTIKGILEISPSYNLLYRKTKFDVNTFTNQEFLRHNIGLLTTTLLPKRLEWRNDINYIFNPDVASGFDRNSIFWNSTLVYSILKNKATISLKVYDLLNQNTNAQRSANQSFIQDAQSLVLQQYFLLGFSLKFNNLDKNEESEVNDFLKL